MTSVPGWSLPAAKLRFDPAMPSRVGTHAFKALRTHGPYDNTQIELRDGSVLFVFPQAERDLAHRLADSLLKGVGSYPGFQTLFRVEVPMPEALKGHPVDTQLGDLSAAARAFRESIGEWNRQPREREPDVAIVLVPHSERFETQSPYYEAKAAFANLGIPTQMVTTQLLRDERQFQWSVANIALAVFAKLGGVPWAVAVPAGDTDLIIGIGRAEVGRDEHRRRYFGYAVAFVSNGIYRQTYSFTPAADERVYGERLQAAIEAALRQDVDERPRRLVIHLAKNTGTSEIEAARRAMDAVGFDVPVAFLRLDDTTLHDIADTGQATFAPPKGLVARLGPRRALLQAEALGALGPPDGPLLIAMDRRSTAELEVFDELVGQVFRLAHANWRGFNAQSKPATLVYGEQLASLVGHLQDVEAWSPELLRSELQHRPWFL